VLRVIAPAKLNLHLGVGPRRADGYHDVTTVLHALELHDTLTISPADALSVACVPDVGVEPEANLVHRAAVALGVALDREPAFSIAVEKRIPHGAGLGGGSSDAAAAIAGLATLWDVDPLDERCVRVAATLGADVPFFLERTGAALMTGRGDVTESVIDGLAGTAVALVKPLEPVSTAAAYRAFEAAPVAPGGYEAVVAALAAADPLKLAAALHNNMTSASISVTPEVGSVLEWVSGHEGVVGAAVAGSGSAVFGLCAGHAEARQLCDEAALRGWWSQPTALRARGVEVCREERG
jgi:4-diphosphocytidyl-2-C-methyl-D-erythritol kinase